MQGDEGAVWSWAVCVRHVEDGLLPEVDFVVFGDNDDPNAAFTVPWADALRLAGAALRPEPGYDPPLVRHHGSPDPDVVDVLRKAAVPFP